MSPFLMRRGPAKFFLAPQGSCASFMPQHASIMTILVRVARVFLQKNMPKANTRLKAIVEERGIKLRELGELMGGMAESTVGNIVNRKTNTTFETITKMAKALKVPPAEIVAPAEPGPHAALRGMPSPPGSPLEIRIYSLKLQIRQLMEGFDTYEHAHQLEAAEMVATLAGELAQKLKEKSKPREGRPPAQPSSH
jgi:antitoxin component HigA of HigAB toxin-antitoxin module